MIRLLFSVLSIMVAVGLVVLMLLLVRATEDARASRDHLDYIACVISVLPQERTPAAVDACRAVYEQ